MNGPPDGLKSRLIDLVHSSGTLMRALRAARAVDPPDWLIGAGVIRDLATVIDFEALLDIASAGRECARCEVPNIRQSTST